MPASKHEICGRAGFLIHGDNTKGNQSASMGCMIFQGDIRDEIGSSGDTDLVVEDFRPIIVPFFKKVLIMLKFLILMFAGSSLACAGEKPDSIAIRDKPSVRILASRTNFKVAVSITTRIVSGDDPRLTMCAGTTHPCRGVERIQIAVNGSPLFVPTSLFFDLADLRNGQVKFSGSDVILLLTGGDASESYGVNIRFNADRVLARTLFSALTPDEPLQETTYHEVALD